MEKKNEKKVFVVGGGGREHALIWKISQSPEVSEIFCVSGNAGISQLAKRADVEITDISALADFAEKKSIDLTIVGPESFLAEGIVDEFEKRGLKIFGTSKAAAQIEASKPFAKKIMLAKGIPTARYREFSNEQEALDYLKEIQPPIVIKAAGLTAGKGVTVVRENINEAFTAVKKMMADRIFGSAGDAIIIEEFLSGPEITFQFLTDGKRIIPLLATQDCKPIYEGGPNTGGMWSYVLSVSEELKEKILKEIAVPLLEELASLGITYKGVIYIGLMMTSEGPKVLEFNCRFGDPEWQCLAVMMKSDILPILEAVAEGRLTDEMEIEWYEGAAFCLVLASGGYPGKYEIGKEIKGLKEAAEMENAVIFHAGTKKENGKFLTAGGRVLNIVARGETLEQAIEIVERTAEKITWDSEYHRKDAKQKVSPCL